MSVNKKLLYQQKFLTGKTGQSISTSSFTVKELWKKKNEREIFIPVYIYIYICIYICIYIYIYNLKDLLYLALALLDWRMK